MLRSQFVRGLGAALLLGFAAPPLRVAFAATPQDAQPDPNTLGTPEDRMNRRYPQPVRVGFLIGLPVLDQRDSTYGYIRAVVRTGAGMGPGRRLRAFCSKGRKCAMRGPSRSVGSGSTRRNISRPRSASARMGKTSTPMQFLAKRPGRNWRPRWQPSESRGPRFRA